MTTLNDVLVVSLGDDSSLRIAAILWENPDHVTELMQQYYDSGLPAAAAVAIS